jgi:hypothetical protein
VTFDGMTFERTKFHFVECRTISKESSRAVIKSSWLKDVRMGEGDGTTVKSETKEAVRN